MDIEFNKKILKYWRNSIADSSRISINLKNNNSTFIKEESITSGYISKDEALAVISQLNICTSNIKNSKTAYFDAHISPLSIKPEYNYARKNNSYASKEIHPMWIPCKLQLDVTEDGNYSIQLRIGDICTPWIPRDVLSPQVNNYNSVIISDIDTVDDYMTQHGRFFDSDSNWDDYLSYAEDMFSKIIDSRGWKNYERNGCYIKNEYILVLTKIDETSQTIIKAYNCILEKKSLPSLLKNITSRTYSDIRPEIEHQNLFNASINHKGQMTNIHSLAVSQRKSLLNYTVSEHGDVFACSGPAGTGKTTLIQNILATELVSRAINEEEAPIIIASSTNNQAITNILASFAETETQGHPDLVKRWLPDIHSFGLYMPSKTASEKLDKTPNIQICQDLINPDGFAAMVLDKQYLKNAEKVFLEKFYKNSKKATNNINEAFEYLKYELKSLDKILCAGPILWEEKLNAETKLKEQAIKKIKYEIEITNLEKHLNNLSNTISEIEISRKSCPWHVKLFFLLPSSKKYIEAGNKLIFLNNSLEGDIKYSSYTDVKVFLFENKSKKQRIINYLKNKILEFEKLIKNYEEIVNKWNEWKVTAGITSDPPQAVDELDRTIRFKMFYTAVHYYEAKFLVLGQKHSTKNHSSKARLVSNIRLLANITPCFISTFHMNLKNFSSWTKKDDSYYRIPLPEISDLLIIDESGQVLPDISGASFYLAKKAFVVGDVKQIEPVYKIPLNIDQGNMIKASISSKEDIEDTSVEMHNKGFSVTKGSIMKLAQKSCSYHLPEHSERGFMLLEHRRCPDTIIGYCNELCYNGQLIPLTGEREITDGLLPFFGFANITGKSASNLGSRSNKLEAEVIAEWLSRHKDEFESQFNNTIDNIICVITPFAAQAREIKKMLLKYKVKEAESSEFKIGTVHALQGSFRPIVIFSPTYGANNKNAKFFFDRTESMLNVAVSRTKYSFLVFGYMSHFNPVSTTPSGILAKYLFSSSRNEITDIMQTPKIPINEDPIIVLNTHEKHIEHLKQSINEAKNEIVITSPFISIHAVKSCGITDEIKSAADRNVKVLIYTDSYFDYEYGKQKQNSIDGHSALKKAGAIIRIIDKMHNKTLAVDEQSFSEGSFNWLSAVGDSTCIYNRLERSIVYSGPDAAKLIRVYKKSLEKS